MTTERSTGEDLRKLTWDKEVAPDKEVIAYCRFGERSSHTWFVLEYLLGYPSVKNYDGSGGAKRDYLTC